MTLVDDMDEMLRGFGVDAGDIRRRRDRAQALVAEGVAVDDVELLGRHCEASFDEQHQVDAVRLLCSILYDPAKRTARLADLRKAAQARQERRATHYPGSSYWQSPAPNDGEERRAMVASCRVLSDRHAPADVARDLEVSLQRLDELIRLGCRLRGVPEPTTEQRLPRRRLGSKASEGITA